MASVVSLSWLQLGKRWRGMKGAAPGGMSGEHFKGCRDRVALGYSGSFSSIHPELPAASPSSGTALKPTGARVKHLQLSSGAGAALRSPQQVSHHPQPAPNPAPPDSEMPTGSGRAAPPQSQRFHGKDEQDLLIREVWAGGEGQKEPEKGVWPLLPLDHGPLGQVTL